LAGTKEAKYMFRRIVVHGFVVLGMIENKIFFHWVLSKLIEDILFGHVDIEVSH